MLTIMGDDMASVRFIICPMSNWLNERQKVSSQEGSEMEVAVLESRGRAENQ